MAKKTTQKPPLDGIRVLDLSRILAGPWCAMLLADLGAEVVKVENPGMGDDTRHFGPPFKETESAYNMAFNRNKRGIVADLKTEEGQGIVRDLAAHSDVLVENFRIGTMERFGLALEDLRKANPRLITVSISGYGRESPLAERAGYDFMIQAESGVMSIIGPPDGPPYRVGIAITDMTAGNNAAQAVLAALYAREKSGPGKGKGQHIDVSLLDCAVAMLSNVASAYLLDGKTPPRTGNAHPNVAPYQPFDTADEPIALAVANDSQYRTLCRLLEREDLIGDARFETNGLRVENREALEAELEGVFKTKGRARWLERLRDAGLPAGAVRTVDEALSSPEVLAHGMITEIPHPTLGTVRLLASPLRLSETPVAAPFHPPTLGEHTAEVLTELLGWDKEKATDYAARMNG